MLSIVDDDTKLSIDTDPLLSVALDPLRAEIGMLSPTGSAPPLSGLLGQTGEGEKKEKRKRITTGMGRFIPQCVLQERLVGLYCSMFYKSDR